VQYISQPTLTNFPALSGVYRLVVDLLDQNHRVAFKVTICIKFGGYKYNFIPSAWKDGWKDYAIVGKYKTAQLHVVVLYVDKN